ncbi:MAG: integrase arm-type DNA-binding domain-containing protein [Rubrivivax sp.]|nr:integrase arm-type DNA-binding domain-containing protein [Rubrivivax sp.]MBK8529178.1 integrase arm-type DNA-binding domain-containing protein [Rubrivivax sp.]
MPKLAEALTALEVKRLTEPGLHAVGTVAGLRLLVKPTGARSWVLRTMVGTRRAELGLGGYPTVTLAQAHDRARTALDQIRAGIDPTAERRSKRNTVEWTFERTALAYIAAHAPSWKNEKHGQQWGNTLTAYAFPVFGHKHVRDVTKADVLAAIEPIWSTKNETATRVRNRIELVLNYAVQRELRPEGLNPARWRGNLDAALPKPGKVAIVEHHAALPIDDMHGFMLRLRQAQGMGARALEFAVLTAARSGEVRGAMWDEIDLQAGVWSIAAGRMKSARPHRVPLSDRALELLQALPRFDGTDAVFPGATGKPLSDMTLTATLRRMKVDATAHGFRSTFRDWCAERTSVPGEVAEMALAHAVGDATEAAYRRGDLFEKRRELMDLWARFIDTTPATGTVRALRKGAA